MKKVIFKINFLAVLFMTVAVVGCERSDIITYEQQAGVYFKNATNSAYSFFENPDKVTVGFDSIYIPVKISGSAVDYDREVNVVVVDTSKKHTAMDKMFTVAKGVVRANMYEGSVPVRINYTKELDDSSRTLVLRVVASDDFQVTDLNGRNHLVIFGNVAQRPENWPQLKSSFGEYSNSWYSFILKASNRNSIPYKYYAGAMQSGITPEEAAKWPMTSSEARAIAFQVKEALINYNAENPGNPLKHEDGEFIGQEVKMKI